MKCHLAKSKDGNTWFSLAKVVWILEGCCLWGLGGVSEEDNLPFQLGLRKGRGAESGLESTP
jgi:hypothetical protein